MRYASLILLVAIALVACDKSTEPGSSAIVAYQVPGCGGNALGKRVVRDSCFSYDFRDALVVDFCTTANCCPDSNRFSILPRLTNDSIIVAIADTAPHNCRCMCPYYLHVEFRELPKDVYQFVVINHDSTDYVLYSEPVAKH